MKLQPFHRIGLLAAMFFIFTASQLPAELPPEAQETMKKGIIAAKQQDYLLAVRYFQDARKIAPDAPEIFFNLGLAESKIPSRELRAIAWFGAYLAATTNAPNAAAVKDQIDALDVKSQSNLSHLIQTVQDAAIKIPIGDVNAWPISGTFHHDEALEAVASLWADSGDLVAAQNAIDLMPTIDDPLGVKENAKNIIVEAQTRFAIDKAEVGDVLGAHRDAKLLPAYSSESVEVAIANAQAKAGDVVAAFETVDLIHNTNRISKVT